VDNFFFGDYEGPGGNLNVACKGGTRCLSVAGSNYACRKVQYVGFGEECSYDFECVGFMSCTTRNSPYPTCQYPTFGQGCFSGNCSFISGQACICSADGKSGVCQKVNADLTKDCNYETTLKNYRDCWERSNCPYDNNMNFFALFIESFPTGTCMSNNCGQIAKDYVCCNGNTIPQGIYSSSYPFPGGCGGINWLLTAFIVIFIFGLIGAGLITTIGGFIIWYRFFKNKKSEPFQRLE